MACAMVRICGLRLLVSALLVGELDAVVRARSGLRGTALPDETAVDFSGYSVFKPAKDVMPSEAPKGVHFLRIQKTGGTTFGEHIMRKFCGPESASCMWASHQDYATATKDWDGPVVTMVRDPVERVMSEFAFIRSKDGNYSCRNRQWDFMNFTWFNSVVGASDAPSALDMYLQGYPNTPSRNRQALYIDGFKKMVDGTPTPEYSYDWDADRSSLVQQAKTHLDGLTAFGITDCFSTSMRVIARELGWPEDEVVAMSQSTHSRQSHKDTPLSFYQESQRAKRWRTSVSSEVVSRIEEMNSVDMEIYKFAQQRFYERFGQQCGSK